MLPGRQGAGGLVAPPIGENSREEAGPRMMRFAVNRIFWFIPTILAMAAFTFLIMHATPGSPFDVSDKQRPEDIKRLEALYGLAYVGQAVNATTISDIWQRDVPPPADARSD